MTQIKLTSMRIPEYIVSFFFLCCFSACSFIAKTVNHARKPKKETAESIVAWIEKQNIHCKNITTVAPSSFYNAIFLYGSGPMIFNKKGAFVSVGYNADVRFCPKGVDEFLISLYPGFEIGDEHLSNYLIRTVNNIEDTVYPRLHEVISFSRDLSGNDDTCFNDLNNYDYTLLLPFSIFMGNTIQVKKIKTFLKAVAQNQSARIKVVMVNFDKQEWWGEEWLKKINIEV